MEGVRGGSRQKNRNNVTMENDIEMGKKENIK